MIEKPKPKEELFKELEKLKLENEFLKTLQAQNITASKKAEKTLLESQRELTSIYNTVGDVIFRLAVEGEEDYRFISVNPSFYRVTGIPPEAVIGKRVNEIINESSLGMVLGKYRQSIEEKTIVRWEETTDYPTGRLIGEVSVAPVFDLTGRCTHLVGSVRDITEQKLTELERQIVFEIIHGITTTNNLNELLKLIHQSLGKRLYADNCFVALYDQNTGLFSFPYFVDKFDQTPEPMALPKSCTAYVFRSGKPLLLTLEVSQQLEEQNEVELIGAPSSSWIGVPLQTPARTIGVLVLQHYEEENVYSEKDVNFLNFVGNHIALAIERKRSEEALRESEVKLNVILQSTADGILAVDAQCKAIKTNDRFAQLWKIPQSLIDKGDDKSLLDFVLEQLIDPEEFMSKVIQLYNSKEVDLDLLHFRDGRIFERYSAPLTMVDSSIGRVWSFRDITDSKLAEEEYRNQQLLLRTVIDNIPDSIYCKDTAGRKTLANVTELSLLEAASEAEIIGKTDFDFYPKDLAEGFFADDQLVIRTGQPVIDREEYLLDKNGQKRWLLTSKLPLKDKEGNIIGIVGIGHNITDRKHADEEIKKRNEELLKSNAEKDKFFSIIAHDLKSPFQGLLGLTEMMFMNDEDFTKEELLQHGKEMFNTASTVYKLLENLLEWAQMQKGSVSFTPKELQISACIEQNIEVLKQRASQKGITLINEVPVNEIVYADEKMVDTILRNLLSNAVKFTHRDGKVIVKSNRTNDEMLEISVHDTGIGMSEKNLKLLFKIEEKVSSKGTEGELSTGLGLLLCKEFVEKNGGKIWVESEEGVGSTFYFTLPARNGDFTATKELSS